MKQQLWICLFTMSLCLWPDPVPGQDTTARSEMEKLRAEMGRMKAQHEAEMKNLQERLMKLEEAQLPGATPALGEKYQKVLGSMPLFYARIVAGLIQRGAILFETTVLKGGE